jgi:hypothetical protein
MKVQDKVMILDNMVSLHEEEIRELGRHVEIVKEITLDLQSRINKIEGWLRQRPVI